MTAKFKIVATLDGTHILRKRNGEIIGAPSLSVEYYDEMRDEVLIEPVSWPLAAILAPTELQNALDAIGWRGLCANARRVA